MQNTSGNISVLNEYLKIFDERIANVTKENALLRILVNNATDHASNLKNLSDFLQSLLRDPNKFAEKALKAARAYEEVVNAIEEVLKLARVAHDNSKIALELVSVFTSCYMNSRLKLQFSTHVMSFVYKSYRKLLIELRRGILLHYIFLYH